MLKIEDADTRLHPDFRASKGSMKSAHYRNSTRYYELIVVFSLKGDQVKSKEVTNIYPNDQCAFQEFRELVREEFRRKRIESGAIAYCKIFCNGKIVDHFTVSE